MKRWILFLTTLLALAEKASNLAAAPANAGTTNGPAFAVSAYQVEGNTVLPQTK
jgi:hypothetical protein